VFERKIVGRVSCRIQEEEKIKVAEKFKEYHPTKIN
jgi:hypothetical protein